MIRSFSEGLFFISLQGVGVENQNLPIQKIGHRGACGHEPENTLKSFKKALELDVNMVELDVHLCKSGQIIVIHDNKVNRTTNGKGLVKNLTLEQLKGLDAGKGEQIPTLEQVLDLVDRKAKIIIELKGKNTVFSVAKLIEKQIRKKGWKIDNFLVISFQHRRIYKVRNINPKIKLGLLFKKPSKKLVLGQKDLDGIDYVVLNFKYINRDFVNLMHEKGIKVFVYTVNKKDYIKHVKTFGVDGIISDYPDRI